MSCALTIAIGLGCADSQGGNEELYVANFANITGIATDASGEVTGITMSGGTKFYTYEQEVGVSLFDETGQRSRENGTSYYDQAGTAVINKITKGKRQELNKLGKALTMVIAKDKNGIYRLFGQLNGMTCAINTTTGTAMGDRNGYTLNFVGMEANQAPIVSTSIIAGITA